MTNQRHTSNTIGHNRHYLSRLVMPFGKYKGIPVGQLPESYISYLHRNVPIKNPKLRDAIESLNDLGNQVAWDNADESDFWMD